MTNYLQTEFVSAVHKYHTQTYPINQHGPI